MFTINLFKVICNIHESIVTYHVVKNPTNYFYDIIIVYKEAEDEEKMAVEGISLLSYHQLCF